MAFLNHHSCVRGSSIVNSGRLRGLGLLVAAWLLAACGSTRTDTAQVPAQAEIIQSSVRFQKEYLLFAGDQIEISVWRVPEVSRTVTIRGDGMISLPLIQDVPAAGLSARELAAKLKTLLSERLINPDVTVIPQQVRQPVVYVLGDVKSPASIPYRNALTAMQAISIAGGFLRTGAERDVTIIRLSKDGYLRTVPIDVQASGQPGPYLAFALTKLEPDDVLFVPENNRSQATRFINDLILLPTQLLLNFKLVKSL